MADNYGLQQAVKNFFNVQQTKKKQKLEEYMAQISRELAERKYAEDVRHSKTMEEYYQGMLAERQKPDQVNFQQYSTDGGYGSFDPSTGEYAQKGEIAPKPQDFNQFKSEKIMQMWETLTPEEQKKALGLGVAGGKPAYTKGQAFDDAVKMFPKANLSSAQQNENMIAIMRGGSPIHTTETPSLQDIQPKADSLYNMQNLGQWTQPGQGDTEIAKAQQYLKEGKITKEQYVEWLSQYIGNK